MSWRYLNIVSLLSLIFILKIGINVEKKSGWFSKPISIPLSSLKHQNSPVFVFCYDQTSWESKSNYIMLIFTIPTVRIFINDLIH